MTTLKKISILISILFIIGQSESFKIGSNQKKLLDYIDPNTFTVKFHIFTTETTKTIDLKSKNSEPISTICDSKKPLIKLIVHGFAETWNMTFRWNWVDDLKREMLNSSEAKQLCIIAVDWEDLARGGKVVMNYWAAISNMKIGANIMSDYINKNKMNEKNFHCIGFSLGAHMCSIFYKTYYNKFGIKPGRITGLDPAGPFFGSKPTNEKLHHTDADLVDIIHTSESFGLPEKNGHMDFYPDLGPSEITACNDFKNRYENQENVILYEETNSLKNPVYEILLNSTDIEESGGINKLSINFVKSKISFLVEKFMEFFGNKPKRVFVTVHQFFGCSHLMSVRFFLYSINQCDFRSFMCKNRTEFDQNNCAKVSDSNEIVRMGYHADKSASNYKQSYGDFFLNTSEKPPYCDTSKNSSKKPGFVDMVFNFFKG